MRIGQFLNEGLYLSSFKDIRLGENRRRGVLTSCQRIQTAIYDCQNIFTLAYSFFKTHGVPHTQMRCRAAVEFGAIRVTMATKITPFASFYDVEALINNIFFYKLAKVGFTWDVYNDKWESYAQQLYVVNPLAVLVIGYLVAGYLRFHANVSKMCQV